ncbi:MAG TPA: hypothetical protein VF844_08275, partial [Ktedonobacteraceae bacterium]
LSPTLSVDTKFAPSLTREGQAKRFKDGPLTPGARQVRETSAWLASWEKRKQSLIHACHELGRGVNSTDDPELVHRW